MASSNVNSMVKEAVRALKANNKAEARALLEKATELDPYNEQAWLWLSGVVDTEADQQTCLQNVLFINPGNENAKQGLAMLEAKSSAKPKTEPKPANTEAFADFDLPSGDDWLAELDEMRTSATTLPTTNPFNFPIDDEYNTGGDAFADPFGDSYGSADGPFSANTSMPAMAPPPISSPAPSKPRADDFDDLDSLFASPPESRPAAGTSSASPSESGWRSKRTPPKVEKQVDPLDSIADDADATTLFRIIPDEIRSTRLPGTARKASTVVRLLFGLMILGNIALITLIFTKVTTP